jgi:WD40-like Beta Propeller Repeat
MLKRFLLPLVLLLALTACQTQAAATQTQPVALPPTDTSAPPTQAVPTPAPSTSTPAAPTQAEPTLTHIPVDLPPAVRAAISQLTQDKGIPADQIQVVSTEAVQWENGCLGIVIPGVMCTQAIVPGFKITLSALGTTYEYHTNQDGSSMLLATSPFLHIAVRLPDGSIQVVPINLLNGRNINPTGQHFNPAGGAVGNKVFALSQDFHSAVAVDSGVTQPLSFITNPSYGLAVWPGDASSEPRLAWGTQLDDTTLETSLMTSAPDGSQLEILHKEQASSSARFQMVAQRWSADGKSLYYSKEPYGIGGYILFDGASSLYRIDLATQQITELIPFTPQATPGVFICLDALSPDYSMVADHCTPGVISVLSLDTHKTATILPPVEVKDKSILGSARFSPDGSRLAFAGAKGNPDAEQGWLAVSEGLGAGSQLIVTSEPGKYFLVLGWLDDSTLLVQSNTVQCSSGECPNEIWTVSADGSGMNKVSDGTFLTFIDGYRP